MNLTHKKFSQKQILYIFVGISFLFHFFLSITQIKGGLISAFKSNEVEKTKPIIIKLQNLKNTEKMQIVQTEQSKNNIANKSRLLSNKNNVFERETKSAFTGSFKTAALGIREAKNLKNQQEQKQFKKEKLKTLKFSDLGFKNLETPIIKQNKKITKNTLVKKGLKSGQKNGISLGQSNDYLEAMPLGDFTKLNTQEYEFYGFYHRVRQKLEQFWGANIQEQAERIFKQGRSLASESNLITGLAISLNSKGEIIDILVKSTSGIKELDDAAIESFNQAGPFPNPPKAMVKSGRATIEWGFVVNT